MAQTTTTKTVQLNPGDCIILPHGAKIVSYVTDGDAILTSTCNDELPEPSTYKCGYFYFNIDNDNNDNHPMDEEKTYVTAVKAGNDTYNMNVLADAATVSALNANIPNQGIFKFTNVNKYVIDDPGTDKRKAVFLYFKVIDALWDKLMLEVKGDYGNLDTIQYYLPVEEPC